ncbi:unnamed protein product [Strongylus vulgaris]|uniref:Uncharacterized protein n=1 Tax=Strongylus vulgaris TaxID=40348 RepID=A0A3P7IQ70_STRVU|nr:unnamed protein product [Strongylus vulgaris]
MQYQYVCSLKAVTTATNKLVLGEIARDYLRTKASTKQYFGDLSDKAHLYNGFQFVGLERNDKDIYNMTSITSMYVDEVKPRSWPPGTYVWGNSPPEKPYRKVSEGKKLFEKFVATLNDETTIEEIIERLLMIGTDETKFFPDPQMALQTGRPPEWYQHSTAIMTKFPLEMRRYGTRSHSILVVDRDDNATFYEKRIAAPPKAEHELKWVDKVITFRLEPVNGV